VARTRGEVDRLVAAREGAVKVGHERVDVVVAVRRQRERHGEPEVVLGHGEDVNVLAGRGRSAVCGRTRWSRSACGVTVRTPGIAAAGGGTHLDGHGVGDEGARLDGVDERLAQRDLFNAAKVKAVHAVPDCAFPGVPVKVMGGAGGGWGKRSASPSAPPVAVRVLPLRTVDLLALVVAVLDSANVDGRLVGEDVAARRLRTDAARPAALAVCVSTVAGRAAQRARAGGRTSHRSRATMTVSSMDS